MRETRHRALHRQLEWTRDCRESVSDEGYGPSIASETKRSTSFAGIPHDRSSVSGERTPGMGAIEDTLNDIPGERIERKKPSSNGFGIVSEETSSIEPETTSTTSWSVGANGQMRTRLRKAKGHTD